MAYADLIPSAIMFGSDFAFMQNQLSDYPSATDATLIFLSEARYAVKVDLYKEWELIESNTSDATHFEERVSTVEEEIKRAIATMQLVLFFRDQQLGVDDASYRRWRDLESQYNTLRNSFSRLGTRTGSRVSSTTIAL